MTIKSAMIMAAGRGTRMLPLTNTMAKPMIKVGDLSLIEFAMQKLLEAKVEHLVINLHHHWLLLKNFVLDLSIAKNFSITFSYEEELLEAGGIVKVIEALDEEFYLLNADCLWRESKPPLLLKMHDMWDAKKMDALLALQPLSYVRGHDGRGDFNLSKENKIIINSKNNEYVFSGTRIMHKRVFAGIEVHKFNFFKDLLFKNRLIQDNVVDGVYGLVHQEMWYDVGNLAGLEVARREW
jgi:MurNAc alpha-1-phosphate uridylyltransferase